MSASEPNLRSRLSSFVNRALNKAGYAIIRIDGEGRQPTFSEHQGVRYAYENIIIPDVYAPWALDESFMATWENVRSNTLVDVYRAYELHQIVQTLSDLPGDILEVGVWRGGTGAVLAAAAKRWKPDSSVWLCDTFSGVVKAGAYDASYVGGEHADTSVSIVADLIGRMGLTNSQILAGTFPDQTGDHIADRPIALCHIDVDVYQSAAEVVTWAAPRMARGAVMVFDDYGFSSCKGITALVNELRLDPDWQYIFNLNKHAILVKR